jgi:hypothetical protein
MISPSKWAPENSVISAYEAAGVMLRTFALFGVETHIAMIAIEHDRQR